MKVIVKPSALGYNASPVGIICYESYLMHHPIETSELLAFTKIVESKSLSRAAAELAAPRATIGRRLARLEERLGVRLIRRTTRSLALTDAGELFYRHARIAVDAVAQAEASLERDDAGIRGTLRVALPPALDVSFHDMLTDFAERYPEVRLELFFSSTYVDLKRDGYDVAMRAGAALEPGLVARTLLRGPLVAVASPAYLHARGTPKTARELAQHRCLLGFARGELPQTQWPRKNGKRLRVDGTFASNDLALLTQAAVRGLGIALLPRLVVAGHLARGELVHVLPDVLGTDTVVALVYLEREYLPAHVRAFVDHVAAWTKRGIFARTAGRGLVTSRDGEGDTPRAPRRARSGRARQSTSK